jgi:DNA-directed RNA polymerase specialized sigma24 family protein
VQDSAGSTDALLKELVALRRLVVLLLAKLGSDSKEIAMALDVDSSTVRGWMPMRKVVRLPIPDSGSAD